MIALGKLHADMATPVHEAQNLTQGGSVAHIVLNGMVYCLRITRQGKLILTK